MAVVRTVGSAAVVGDVASLSRNDRVVRRVADINWAWEHHSQRIRQAVDVGAWGEHRRGALLLVRLRTQRHVTSSFTRVRLLAWPTRRLLIFRRLHQLLLS